MKFFFVSTHSRPKAADAVRDKHSFYDWFQHTAARRRLGDQNFYDYGFLVSTHSRPKAAEVKALQEQGREQVSTHSRPKAAASQYKWVWPSGEVSTHSRPKAAVCLVLSTNQKPISFNTQPPEGG